MLQVGPWERKVAKTRQTTGYPICSKLWVLWVLRSYVIDVIDFEFDNYSDSRNTLLAAPVFFTVQDMNQMLNTLADFIALTFLGMTCERGQKKRGVQ